MSKVLKYLARFVGAFGLFLLLAPSAHAATNGRMIDDGVFDASGTMSATDIQAFLNSFPNGCLKSYTDDMPSADPTRAYFDYSGTGSAAQIIRRVADNYGINPRVLLTKLEQESSLISGGGGCQLWRQASAIGFKCYDGANPRTTTFRGTSIQTCVATDADMGVARQLSKGGWLLKWGKERANGNLSWMVPDDAASTYGGPMTQGSKKRCAACATVYYDGYWNGVYLQSGATASLYNYTPYLNQAFDDIWEGWWGAGSTYTLTYGWQVVSQTSNVPWTSVNAGQRVTVTVVAKNTGTGTWYNSGENAVHIAALRPGDRSSAFATAGWLSPSRAANMQETSVAPGANGTFSFTMQAPMQAGNYTEYFGLVVENVMWLPDLGLAFAMNVSAPNFQATVVDNGLPATASAGANVVSYVKVRNDSNVTWYNDGNFPAQLILDDSYKRRSIEDPGTWLSPTKVVGAAEAVVAPGAVATFNFTIKAPTYNGVSTEVFSLSAPGLGKFGPQIFRGVTVSNGTALQSIPVYRLYNPRRNTHFFTSSLAEASSVQANLGFSMEGPAFSVASVGTTNPVYRLYNPYRDTHFYTSSAREVDNAIYQLGFSFEGQAFNVPPSTTGTPVYRLYNPGSNTHFFTASQAELTSVQQNLGFRLEGMAFYSLP